MPPEHIAVATFARIQRQAQQLGRPFDRFAVHDPRNAQVDLAEVFNTDGGGKGFSTGVATCYSFHSRLRRFGEGWRLKKGFKLLGVHPLHQVLVGRDGLHVARHIPHVHGPAHKGLYRLRSPGNTGAR